MTKKKMHILLKLYGCSVNWMYRSDSKVCTVSYQFYIVVCQSILENTGIFTLKQFLKSVSIQSGLVLAIGLGNPQAVRVRIAEMDRFDSRNVEKHDPLLLGVPNLEPYLSMGWLHRVWLDRYVPISGSGFCVLLFIITFRYPTANHKILTLVHLCTFLMDWPPLYSKTRETRSLPHPENGSQWRVNNFWSCKSGNSPEPWSF